jgi:hypothetical protein
MPENEGCRGSDRSEDGLFFGAVARSGAAKNPSLQSKRGTSLECGVWMEKPGLRLNTSSSRGSRSAFDAAAARSPGASSASQGQFPSASPLGAAASGSSRSGF